MILLALLVVVASFTVMLFLGFQRANSLVTELDRADERKLVANYIDGLGSVSIGQQKVQVTWDDAFKAIGQSSDLAWADVYLGEFLWTTFGYQHIFLVDGEGRLMRAWTNGKPDAANHFAAIHAAVRADLSVMTRNGSVFGEANSYRVLADDRWPFDAGGRPLTRWAKSIVRFGGQPHLMTIASVLPDTNYAWLTRRPNHLVVLQHFDRPMLERLDQALLIAGTRVERSDRSNWRTNALPLVGREGDTLAWLNWPSPPRNALVVARMKPIYLAYVILLLVLMAGGLYIVRALQRTTRELQARGARALYDASHDTMTGLPNRAHFFDELTRRLAKIDPSGTETIVVAFFDLDHFKYINDTLGHPVGDQLICQVAERCRSRLPREDLLARLGGDEYVVVRHIPGNGGAIEALGEELMAIFAAPFDINGRSLDVTASCGVSYAPRHGMTADALLQSADIALYRAKLRGRARWREFTAEMAGDVERRLEYEIELRKAIQKDCLRMAYQPIVDTQTGAIVGAEALLRWAHPVLGDVGPSTFVPIAEQAGLMEPLGWWTIGSVFRQHSAWPELEVSINLSPLQLRARGFLTDLDALVADTRVSTGRITFEITEGMLLERGSGVFEILEGLRERGFKIALDNFGTGYSSLSYLSTFRFDRLKVDRAFVQNIENNLDAQSILTAIVTLGHSLRMKMVAEGVETLVQRELVRAAGCEMIQGHFYWEAMEAEKLIELISRNSKPGTASQAA